MAGDDVTITIRARNGDAVRAFRDTENRLRDMRGRFASEGSIISRAMKEMSGAAGSLLPVLTAAVPLAASFGAVALKASGATAAAGVEVGAFGAALAGQIGSLSDAVDAQTKYTDAVQKSGARSKEAAEAQRMVQAQFASMPQATQRTAVALGTLKDSFQGWSDSLAGFTMNPVEKSFSILGRLMPKLTPMVKDASTQLDRLVSVAGGAIASPGFDALASRFSDFASSSLKSATDGLIHFARVLSEGDANGPIKVFMDFAAKNGPALRDTLHNAGAAVMTLVEASAEAGPGMLSLVNAALKLVAALPPELVARMMQAAVALKAMKIAGIGFSALSTGVAAFSARLVALRAASTAAGGGLRGLRAAAGSMSTSFKAGVVVGGLALLTLGIKKLAENARGAPPDVDKLTTSLKGLASSGKFTGELKATFGDVDGLVNKIKLLNKETAKSKETAFGFRIPGLDDLADSIAGAVNDMSKGDKSLNALKDDFGGLDKSMANLVQAGYGDAAAKDFATIKEAALSQGRSLKEVNALFPEYKSALSDQKFEQDLVAESMGIFGQAAADTSAKLDAQKSAADGLRASLLALNDANRSAYDAEIGFEAAMDGLTESFKKNGATLDLHTEKGRANGQAMSAAAKSQDEFISAGLAAGDSLASMASKSDKLRGTMMKLATEAFDGNTRKAREYVNTLLGTPKEVKTLIKAEKAEAVAGLKEVEAAIRRTPGKKSVKVDTLNGAAIAALEKVGLKTKQLPNGKTRVYTANGQSLGSIAAVRRALANLNGKTARTWTIHTIKTNYVNSLAKRGQSVHDVVGATGGLYTGASFKRGYADGGPVTGPGTGTSDDVFAPWLSNGEFVMRKAAVDRYGEKFMQLLNEGRLDMPRFARGGRVSKSEAAARREARGDLTISAYGRVAGNKNTEFANALGKPSDIKSLTSALNHWRSEIMKASHGATESRLRSQLARVGKELIKQERHLTAVNKALDKAKDKLSSLKDAASQLSSSVRSGILSGSDITKAAGASDSRVTINTLLSQQAAAAANSSQFASMLKQLKKRGLDKGLIQDIAQAGVEGGGLETAAAVLGGGKGEIALLNHYRAQIAKAAKASGATAADAMYGAGIKAAEGLVKGLQKKEHAIEKQMMKIAKSMEKAIKRALGIHSPSTVMQEVGHYTAEGFARGIAHNRNVMPAWASMLNVPHQSGRRMPGPAGSPADSGRPIVLHVKLGDREFGQLWVDVGRKQVQTRGGLTATLGGL